LTDALFDQLTKVNNAADADPSVLRISFDAKAVVKVGPFSRKGKNRIATDACDHDFEAKAKVVPFGIFLPQSDELFLYCSTSKVTSDFIVDVFEAWWLANRHRFPEVATLLFNQDNGPENHSRRTQFMKRMVEFAARHQVNIKLAYYPPYHSKYNPIERVWGVLEQHWNGSLLDSLDTVLGFARTMKWKQSKPVVHLVEKLYQTGVKLTQKAMNLLEERFERLEGLGKWFVTIRPLADS
jgi:hypothetical protein